MWRASGAGDFLLFHPALTRWAKGWHASGVEEEGRPEGRPYTSPYTSQYTSPYTSERRAQQAAPLQRNGGWKPVVRKADPSPPFALNSEPGYRGQMRDRVRDDNAQAGMAVPLRQDAGLKTRLLHRSLNVARSCSGKWVPFGGGEGSVRAMGMAGEVPFGGGK